MSRSIPEEAERSLDRWLGSGWTARPLAGDASVRAYYRVAAADGHSYILSWYPEEVRAQMPRVVAAYAAVAEHASLPEILHTSDAAMLQHDVGDLTLYDVLHTDVEEGLRLYRAAIEILVAFQDSEDPGLNSPFTADLFFSELEMSREYYVEKLMGFDGAPVVGYMRMIADKVASHPYVLCHRDFHGQNIHVLNESLYLIDYQDLRQGPDLYDLASLLRDRGVARTLGPQNELDLLDRYRRLAAATGDVSRRYFEVLLQRSIKILGTFSKQPIVRGRMHYLDFIPAALESIERCLDELPDFAPLRDIFPLQFSLEAARASARELNGR